MATANLKLKVDATELDATLGKTKRAMGLVHDEYGRLRNASGQFVGGLSLASIKLGDHIDALGRTRNAQEQLVEGLSAAQRNLRMYIDEFGNIRTAEGQFVGFSSQILNALDAETQARLDAVAREHQAKADAKADDEDYTKEIMENCRRRMEAVVAEAEKEAQARKNQEKANQSQQAFASVMGTAASLAGQFATLNALIGKTEGEISGVGKAFVVAGQSFNSFFATVQMVTTIVGQYRALTSTIQGATVAQTLLNAVSGNWITLLLGAGAGVATAYGVAASMAKETDKITQAVDKATTSVDKMAMAWKKVSETVAIAQQTEEGAVSAGMMAAGITDLEQIQAQREEVGKLTDQLEEARKKQTDYETRVRNDRADRNANTSWDGHFSGNTVGEDFRDLGRGVTFGYMDSAEEVRQQKEDQKLMDNQKAAEAADKDLQEANKNLAQMVTNLAQKDLPRDELAELKDRIAFYTQVIDEQGKDSEAGRIAATALANANATLAVKEEEVAQKTLEQQSRWFQAKETRINLEEELAKIQNSEVATAQQKIDAENRLREDYEKQEKEARSGLMGKMGLGQWSDPNKKAPTNEAELNAKIEAMRKTEDYKTLIQKPGGQDQFEEAVARMKADYLEKWRTAADALEESRKNNADALIASFERGQDVSLEDRQKKETDDLLQRYELSKKSKDELTDKEKSLVLTEDEYQKARKALTAKHKQELAKRDVDKAEKDAKARSGRLGELGITSLVDRMKTDWDKFNESIGKIDQAVKEKLISKADAKSYRDFLTNEYYSGKDSGSEAEDSSEKSEALAAYKAPESMRAGSAALYTAMTTQNNSYQARVQNSLARMSQSTQESQNSLSNLERRIESIANQLGVMG